ncbi:MAG: GNAT family N-acetyltransferase [Proteobacteria bacterium]|nr:GNAT family N-acetyltransferase [Pseudomonadota bacterium]
MNYECEKSTQEEQEYIDDRLGDYNLKQVPATQQPLVVKINYCIKEKGKVIAGINSAMYMWNILYTHILFVEEEYRKQNLGSMLIEKVESEAIKLGAKLAHLDTFDFQAKDFYLKQGYEVFGVLEDCPEGHKRYYLKKHLI